MSPKTHLLACTASLAAVLLSATAFCADQNNAAASTRWLKGNVHTHSFWSDGDDFPEMIAEWYKTNNYDFLAFSDHNSIQDGVKWAAIINETRTNALAKYLKRFGPKWVEQRDVNGTNTVRLHTFKEFHSKFDEPEKFLLIPGEEISAHFDKAPLHMGGVNLKEQIQPRSGKSVVDVLDNNLEAVFEQRKRTGQKILAHVNHPNFQWAITAEQLMRVKNEKFFEVYNGHPSVHNEGDATHANTDRIWDIMLAHRLTDLNLGLVYGIGTDDSHHYHIRGPHRNNPGEGWVCVRADKLSTDAIITAMEAGDFYASSGVRLKDISCDGKTYNVEVEPEAGVACTVQFIGTKRDFDTKSEPVRDASGKALPVTRKYSADIGAVLQETKSASASYSFKGDELYVRAKIISTKVKHANDKQKDTAPNPENHGNKKWPAEYETAWTQPYLPKP